MIVPNEIFFKEIKTFLDDNKKVSIIVKGNSMRPFIFDGEKALIVPVGNEPLRKGTIVLAHTSLGVVMHRIIKVIDRNTLLLSGDANAKQVETTLRKEVFGIAESVERNGKNVLLHSPKKLAEAWVWCHLRPIRGILLWIYRRVFNK
jgi:hypothetical protein